MFEDYLGEGPATGKGPRSNDQAYKAMANVLNVVLSDEEKQKVAEVPNNSATFVVGRPGYTFSFTKIREEDIVLKALSFNGNTRKYQFKIEQRERKRIRGIRSHTTIHYEKGAMHVLTATPDDPPATAPEEEGTSRPQAIVTPHHPDQQTVEAVQPDSQNGTVVATPVAEGVSTITTHVEEGATTSDHIVVYEQRGQEREQNHYHWNYGCHCNCACTTYQNCHRRYNYQYYPYEARQVTYSTGTPATEQATTEVYQPCPYHH